MLYPLAFSLAGSAGAKPGQGERQRLGAYLMFSNRLGAITTAVSFLIYAIVGTGWLMVTVR